MPAHSLKTRVINKLLGYSINIAALKFEAAIFISDFSKYHFSAKFLIFIIPWPDIY